jgi:hypothetical protein
VAAAIIAWIYFASTPPMRVLVGTRPLDVFVPAHYQASAFPAFAAYVTALASDIAARGDPRRTLRRVALVLVTSGLAIVRLRGALPLSGHALFLAAVMANELPRRVRRRIPIACAFAVPGLAITAWYKVAVWHDYGWFAASLVVGFLLGLVLGSGDPERSSLKDSSG